MVVWDMGGGGLCLSVSHTSRTSEEAGHIEDSSTLMNAGTAQSNDDRDSGLCVSVFPHLSNKPSALSVFLPLSLPFSIIPLSLSLYLTASFFLSLYPTTSPLLPNHIAPSLSLSSPVS